MAWDAAYRECAPVLKSQREGKGLFAHCVGIYLRFLKKEHCKRTWQSHVCWIQELRDEVTVKHCLKKPDLRMAQHSKWGQVRKKTRTISDRWEEIRKTYVPTVALSCVDIVGAISILTKICYKWDYTPCIVNYLSKHFFFYLCKNITSRIST